MNSLLCAGGKTSGCQLNSLESRNIPWRAPFLLFIISNIVRCTVRLETCIKLTSKCHIWSTALYGAETWTIWKVD
jgi:hypothetical protein